MRSFTILFLTMLIVSSARAQYDTAYFSAYPRRITGRIYFSNKYTVFRFQNDRYKLRYEPNTSVNLGVGATYKSMTLNLGVGVLNRNPGKGRTRYLDLQFHNYGRRYSLDLFGQFYRGFYLFPKGSGTSDDSFYKRPDLHVNEIGGNFQYIFNHRRFSYRAGFLQNEWQKKSAGSLLLGFESYYGKITADSSIVPALADKEGFAENIREIRFFEIGPNIGYAYTLVIHRHYFATGSAAISLDYGSSSIQGTAGTITQHGFSPNTLLRFCAGYNSARYALSLLYINNGVQGAPVHSFHQVALNTGNFRIIVARRFIPTKKERELLKAIP